MNTSSAAEAYLKELESEAIASRKCLERIPETKFDFKPHPTSMAIGYLALLVAEIPKWITYMIEKGEIDFATFKHAEINSTEELVNHFDENMDEVRRSLRNVSDEDLEKIFYLKANGNVLFSAKNAEYIGPTINHWGHHRGQLTVYMRICEIPVPSIYGPSADDRNF
ncbi:MAG: damage-inducible protein DinB [Bacteroidota bacterium]|nr:damage-inducible protein DinB [Bacteroidota bacterium]